MKTMITKILILSAVLLFIFSDIKAYDYLSSEEDICKIDCEIKSLCDLKKCSEEESHYENNFSKSILSTDIDLNGKHLFLNKGKVYDKNPDYIVIVNDKKPKLDLADDYKPWDSKKRVKALVAEMVILEFIPWGIAKFFTKPGWDKVGTNTWWNNISHGFTYDTDNFLTNHFSHPYHGNLFYNAARTNGYGFWESAPFAFLGSAFWEYFGETFRPSINDWINTGVSGVNLGEMTYRLSSMITDNTATGSDRMWTEIFGALVNPVRGFNRLISGETSRIFPNPSLKKPGEFFISVNAGVRRIVTQGSDIAKDGFNEGLFGFDILYGNQFKNNLKIPFSNFVVSAALSNGSSRVAELHSYGILTGWRLKDNVETKHNLSVILTYDFTSNPAYEFGGPTLAGNLGSRFELSKKLNIVSNVSLGALLMGGTPDEFYYGSDGRDYDFGPGVIMRIFGSLNGPSWQYANLQYTSFWLWTQAGTPDSKHHVHNLNVTGTLPVNSYFGIGLSAGVYWRESYYAIQGNVYRTSPVIRAFFVTKL